MGMVDTTRGWMLALALLQGHLWVRQDSLGSLQWLSMPLRRQQIPAWESTWSTATLPAQMTEPSISLAVLERCWQQRTWSPESGPHSGQGEGAATSPQFLAFALLSFQPTPSPPLPDFFGPLSFHSPGIFIAASQLQVKSPSTSFLPSISLLSPFTPPCSLLWSSRPPPQSFPHPAYPAYPCPSAARILLWAAPCSAWAPAPSPNASVRHNSAVTNTS